MGCRNVSRVYHRAKAQKGLHYHCKRNGGGKISLSAAPAAHGLSPSTRQCRAGSSVVGVCQGEKGHSKHVKLNSCTKVQKVLNTRHILLLKVAKAKVLQNPQGCASSVSDSRIQTAVGCLASAVGTEHLSPLFVAGLSTS